MPNPAIDSTLDNATGRHRFGIADALLRGGYPLALVDPPF